MASGKLARVEDAAVKGLIQDAEDNGLEDKAIEHMIDEDDGTLAKLVLQRIIDEDIGGVRQQAIDQVIEDAGSDDEDEAGSGKRPRLVPSWDAVGTLAEGASGGR